jgi:hypothetical protein
MSAHPHPAGRSKTDLRRGRFTPAQPAVAKVHLRAAPKATTNAEQALLFNEPAAPEPASHSRRHH